MAVIIVIHEKNVFQSFLDIYLNETCKEVALMTIPTLVNVLEDSQTCYILENYLATIQKRIRRSTAIICSLKINYIEIIILVNFLEVSLTSFGKVESNHMHLKSEEPLQLLNEKYGSSNFG